MEILSIVGSHATESVEDIFNRKISDIEKHEITFWLYKSWGCKPPQCKGIKKVAFLESANQGKSARPTVTSDKAREYSLDNKNWKAIPCDLHVTGNLPAYALVLSDITRVDEEYCLGNVRFMLGKSTVINRRRSRTGKMRRVLAWGKLKNVVYVR